MKECFTGWELQPIPWPVRSPDLSPVENMWNIIRLAAFDKEYETFEVFAAALRTAWFEFDQKKIDNWINSYPKRL